MLNYFLAFFLIFKNENKIIFDICILYAYGFTVLSAYTLPLKALKEYSCFSASKNRFVFTFSQSAYFRECLCKRICLNS